MRGLWHGCPRDQATGGAPSALALTVTAPVSSTCSGHLLSAPLYLHTARLSAIPHPARSSPPAEAQPSTPPPPSSQAAAAAAAAAEATGADAGTSGGPATAEQWVEVLVGEMSAARDLTDARTRAAGFLRQFEAFVVRYVRQQQVWVVGVGTKCLTRRDGVVWGCKPNTKRRVESGCVRVGAGALALQH